MIVWYVLSKLIRLKERDGSNSWTDDRRVQIPLCDNLLQIEMPDTPLTEILQDFRSYRPGNHREFLEWVKNRAEDVGVRSFAMKERSSAGESFLHLPSLSESLISHRCADLRTLAFQHCICGPWTRSATSAGGIGVSPGSIS